MKYTKAFLFLILFLLSVSIAFATTEDVGAVEDIKNFVYNAARWWWGVLILGLILIVIGIGTRKLEKKILGIVSSKTLLYAGIVGIFIGVFLFQILYLLPHLGFLGGQISYRTCENIFPSTRVVYNVSISIVDPDVGFQLDYKRGDSEVPQEPLYNFMAMAACIFSGYAPESLNVLAVSVFIIFIMILPIAILASLFWAFSDFLPTRGVRRVIAFSATLIAYRALISSFFIDFITFGFGGIGLLLINYLFFGYMVTWVRKMFAFTERLEFMHGVQDLAKLDRLEGQLETLNRAWNEAILMKDKDRADALKKEIKEIEEEIEKLAKKVEKEGIIKPKNVGES